MKVVFSRRFEADLDRVFRESIQRFGEEVASKTFLRIDRALRIVLAERPHLGRYIAGRSFYRYVVRQTPFVIYYQIRDGRLVAVSLRHGAQHRSEFETR